MDENTDGMISTKSSNGMDIIINKIVYENNIFDGMIDHQEEAMGKFW